MTIKLTHEITFLVPSTAEKSNKITKTAFNKRADTIAKILSDTFGGATITDAQGLYFTQDGEKIGEQVKQVTAYADNEAYIKNHDSMIELARKCAKNWSQESIGLKLDSTFYILA